MVGTIASCGGLERIQKANEFCHRRKGSIIVVHIMIVVSLMIVLLAR